MELTGLLKLLILPLKFITVAIFSTLVRIVYDKDKLKDKAPEITWVLVFTRILMSLFVLMIGYYALTYFTSIEEDTAIMLSGGFAFAFREIMDTFLSVAKKPSKIKEILLKGSDTVDPSGEEFPDEEDEE